MVVVSWYRAVEPPYLCYSGTKRTVKYTADITPSKKVPRYRDKTAVRPNTALQSERSCGARRLRVYERQKPRRRVASRRVPGRAAPGGDRPLSPPNPLTFLSEVDGTETRLAETAALRGLHGSPTGARGHRGLQHGTGTKRLTLSVGQTIHSNCH